MSLLIHHAMIQFPEIKLAIRDGHKLRGHFGNLFKEHSPLLHNHLESGELIYRYPLVQYKILSGTPTLVGINEGADLLIQLFMKIKKLEVNGISYPIGQKNIESNVVSTGISGDLHAYRFDTLWMALNQKNYATYIREDDEQKSRHLKAVLVGNILSFYKAMGYKVPGPIMAKLNILAQKETYFKNNAMIAFEGDFVTNTLLPSGIGLGKQTARGFGTISKI